MNRCFKWFLQYLLWGLIAADQNVTWTKDKNYATTGDLMDQCSDKFAYIFPVETPTQKPATGTTSSSSPLPISTTTLMETTRPHLETTTTSKSVNASTSTTGLPDATSSSTPMTTVASTTTSILSTTTTSPRIPPSTSVLPSSINSSTASMKSSTSTSSLSSPSPTRSSMPSTSSTSSPSSTTSTSATPSPASSSTTTSTSTTGSTTTIKEQTTTGTESTRASTTTSEPARTSTQGSSSTTTAPKTELPTTTSTTTTTAPTTTTSPPTTTGTTTTEGKSSSSETIIKTTSSGSSTSRTTEQTTTSAGSCTPICPDGFTEGKNGCLTLLTKNGTYTNSLGYCRLPDNGDMLAYADFKNEFDAVSTIMRDNGMESYKFYVNGYATDLVRKNRSAQVIYVAASSYALTSNDSIVLTKTALDVGAICKQPKNCVPWTCPSAAALADAPFMKFVDPQPANELNTGDSVKYQCTDQSVSKATYTASCTARGAIGPAASIFNANCAPEAKPKVRDEMELESGPVTCSMCFDVGTDHCEKAENGTESCVCHKGWKGSTCNRMPKFCPNTTCGEEQICVEMVDHAICNCVTEKCVLNQRIYNRTTAQVVLDSVVMIGGPSLEFFIRMILQVLFPERGSTIQDSLQYMRSTFVSCAGVIFVIGGDPTTLSMDIAERRVMSLMFNTPQLLVNLLYAIEVMHIDSVMKGKSDNRWATRSGEMKKRWDYGYTYVPTITLGVAATTVIWFLNWSSHQTEYSSLGIIDDNLGMMGWMSMAFVLCAVYSFAKAFDILMCEQRKKLEEVRRDNFYETHHDPSKQEDVDAVWRNLRPSLIGAPVQCLYSISVVAVLAYGTTEVKILNLCLCVLNCLCSAMQTVRTDRGMMAFLKALRMCRRPLVEAYNEYSYLTTSETIAKRGQKQYDDMMNKRNEMEMKKKEEHDKEIEDRRRQLAAEGIPSAFLPHVPLEGPEPCKVYEYDVFARTYLSAREREWHFARWTKEYLAVRVRLDISVSDACEKVWRDLQVNGFLYGDDCPSKQANLMFTEWMDMMIYQDRIETLPNLRSDTRFYKSLPAGFRMELLGLTLAHRVKEAPIDPKKKRLLGPVMDMFEFTCPDEVETAPGIYKDHFGFLWHRTMSKDLPVITRAQEERAWVNYLEGKERDNVIFDRIYTDDQIFYKIRGKPYEQKLREIMNIHESHPEGPKKKSVNPRKTTLEYDYFVDQKHPDFIGPRTRDLQLPGGPYLRRYFMEQTYQPVRERVFNLIAEQAAYINNNQLIRNVLRNRT